MAPKPTFLDADGVTTESAPVNAMRPATPDVLTIASFNTHYGIGRDGRPFDMVGACRTVDAEVIAFQEVWWPDGGVSSLDGLRREGYHVVEFFQARAVLVPTPDVPRQVQDSTGWWGVGIASRHPLASAKAIDIGTTPLDPVGRRWALRVEVGISGAEPISVTTVHATHYVPLAPLHHRRLARAMEGAARSVICGDFNLWGPLAGLSFRQWQRPVRGRSYPAHRPHSLIDHVFVTSDLEVARWEVVRDVGSDHLPVRVQVRTPPLGSRSGSRHARCGGFLSRS